MKLSYFPKATELVLSTTPLTRHPQNIFSKYLVAVDDFHIKQLIVTEIEKAEAKLGTRVKLAITFKYPTAARRLKYTFRRVSGQLYRGHFNAKQTLNPQVLTSKILFLLQFLKITSHDKGPEKFIIHKNTLTKKAILEQTKPPESSYLFSTE